MIIDFRARPNTPEYMSLYTEQRWDKVWARFGSPKPEAQSLSDFVTALDRNDIAHAVFNGRISAAPGRPKWGVSNDYVANCVSKFPDRLTGFGAIDPLFEDAVVRAEVHRCIESLKLIGVSVDPDLVGAPINAAMYRPAFEEAALLGVPVMITTGPLIGELARPWDIDEVARRHPDLVLICSHGCWPWVDEFLALGYRNENVYLETSIYFDLPGAERVLDAASGILRGRVLYGSAFPFKELETSGRFRLSAVPAVTMEELLFGNARALLGRFGVEVDEQRAADPPSAPVRVST